MYHFAIIDDEDCDRKNIHDMLTQAAADFQLEMKVDLFGSAFDFLEDKNRDIFDAIFLDIDMPGMKGIEMAKRLREKNETTCIIFVTKMAQYALDGYSVQALDFLVKPVQYSFFRTKVSRLLNAIKKEQQNHESIIVNQGRQVSKIEVDSIYYIEVRKNDLIYYTKNGEFKERKPLSKAEEELSSKGFSRCNNAYLVNLRYVDKLSATLVVVHGTELSLSRTYKNSFFDAFNFYLGEGGR